MSPLCEHPEGPAMCPNHGRPFARRRRVPAWAVRPGARLIRGNHVRNVIEVVTENSLTVITMGADGYGRQSLFVVSTAAIEVVIR